MRYFHLHVVDWTLDCATTGLSTTRQIRFCRNETFELFNADELKSSASYIEIHYLLTAQLYFITIDFCC